VRLTLLPVLLALAGCAGGGGGGGGSADRAAAAPATTARAVDLDPEVTGRELLRVERTGPEPGAHDLVKFGSDGSAVIVKAYGGGGEVIRLCTLRTGVLGTLHRRLAVLPLGPNRKAPPHRFISIYTNSPARYTLVAGRSDASFSDGTMPRDARPLVRLVEDTLHGHAADCRTTYRSRAS
jgi:hypothetical protein